MQVGRRAAMMMISKSLFQSLVMTPIHEPKVETTEKRQQLCIWMWKSSSFTLSIDFLMECFHWIKCKFVPSTLFKGKFGINVTWIKMYENLLKWKFAVATLTIKFQVFLWSEMLKNLQQNWNWPFSSEQVQRLQRSLVCLRFIECLKRQSFKQS